VGRLEPRHLDLRPFAVNDGERRCGCCPVGSPASRCAEGSLVVNSSQGGGSSKDTWVLSGLVSETGTFHPIVLSTPDGTTSDRAARDGAATETTAPVEPLSGLVVGPWEDSAPEQQQQQQQQQVSRPAVAPC
jgi:hypothetical protein